ncbi:hypothetical protein [Helicobacter pylori]|uniref:hypothetical protein n=1 Tax=Helicobacter pylori TaxID=210 RepID=UPI0003AC8DEC|nr:hypothetical protein [Helicobacter pylori]EPZ96860.1 hypothetical protein N202_04080 [Helicobacter pylori UM067]
MKVTQGITNDFFALTNTIFSILIHQRNHTLEENCEKLLMYCMGSIAMLSIK